MSLPSAEGKILIVDDQETSLYNKSRIMRRAGFPVIEVRNGHDALESALRDKPRLILLDVQLPDIDGWEVCRRLKAAPETAGIPVLQVSATYVTEADTVRALEGGADACLMEPLDPPVLVATVRALLRARAAEEALRDALEREHAARISAESANRAKDEFLATLSHELRSPLGVILSWVSLLRRKALPPERASQALEVIERNAHLQTRLIADLLDVSAIISGKMRLEVSTVGLDRAIDRAIETVRPAADAKGVEISLQIPVEPSFVAGDPSRLQQVAWNLLSNAVKFTPKGGRVSVSVERSEGEARIRVSDTGKGIAADLLPYVFERFRQGDSSTTRTEGGLGLGLAIVRHLVELHGGRVAAESPGPGLGATFLVTLPLATIPEGASHISAAGGSRPSPAGLPTLSGLLLLVVDDEADSREAIRSVLSAAGAEVESAASVAEALDMIAVFRPGAIVTDIGMPGEDGFSLLRRLREREAAEGERTPVLALTAYTGGENQRRVLEAGFDGYVTKPIEASELAAAVARVAGRHRGSSGS